MAFITGSRPWYDIMAEQEMANETRLVRMTPAEWMLEGRSIIRNWRGDLRGAIKYLDGVDARRAAFPVAPQVVVYAPRTTFDVEYGLWRDMVNEPAKYGDDIIEWLALDEKLSAGSGRWRLGAYWCAVEKQEAEREEERKARERYQRRNDAATVIAAAVRGHQARTKQVFRDCCMCLSHRTSPLKTLVGMMCRGCSEQGPYTEATGPLADPWSEFRADYIDLAPPAPCQWCRAPLTDGQTGDHCDQDCLISDMKDLYRARY